MDKKKLLHDFLQEFWYLIKNNMVIPDDLNHAAWDQLVDDGDALGKKYGSNDAEGQFVRQCIIAWFDYLRNKSKEG